MVPEKFSHALKARLEESGQIGANLNPVTVFPQLFNKWFQIRVYLRGTAGDIHQPGSGLRSHIEDPFHHGPTHDLLTVWRGSQVAVTASLVTHQSYVDLDNIDAVGIKAILHVTGHLKLKLVHHGTSTELTTSKSGMMEIAVITTVYLIIKYPPHTRKSTALSLIKSTKYYVLGTRY